MKSTSIDHEIWQDELEDFVPRRVFDVHVHLLSGQEYIGQSDRSLYTEWLRKAFPDGGIETLKMYEKEFLPGREIHHLFCGYPTPDADLQKINKFVLCEANKDMDGHSLMLVHPNMSSNEIDVTVEQERFVGFKPYRIYAGSGDPVNCSITDFMPERFIEIASRRGLIILMHLSKKAGIADKENIDDLRRLCERYPGAKWILAHCARSFAPWPLEKAIGRIKDIPNLWYDTSAVCESDIFDILLSEISIEKILYGTDNIPAGLERGKYISFGKAWECSARLVEQIPGFNLSHCDSLPTLVMYESLRALRRAARRAGLRPNEIENIFYNNAERLINSIGKERIKDRLQISRSLSMYEEACRLMPNGVQLLSRKPSGYAEGAAPIYVDYADGATFTDVDGNTYIDMGMGIGPVILGYRDRDVDTAVKRQVDTGGSIFSINHPVEIELANLICKTVPCAEMVRYCKSGGEANAIAVRIARGYTGHDKILFCGYHGWHDWYIAANLESSDSLNTHLTTGVPAKGVPKTLAGTVIPFEYNNLDALRELLVARKGQVAAIIMEACRTRRPKPGFLEGVRLLADEHGVVLIFDEVVTGFRFAPGGAQKYLGIVPDIATFGKAIANGYPLAAVAGKRAIMEASAEMFISSTYWSDALSITAGLTTIKKILDRNVIGHLWGVGRRFEKEWNCIAKKVCIPAEIIGFAPVSSIKWNIDDEKTALEVSTLYVQEMARLGVYATGVNYWSYAHTDEHVDRILGVSDEVLHIIKKGMDAGDIRTRLRARVQRPLFQRRMV